MCNDTCVIYTRFPTDTWLCFHMCTHSMHTYMYTYTLNDIHPHIHTTTRTQIYKYTCGRARARACVQVPAQAEAWVVSVLLHTSSDTASPVNSSLRRNVRALSARKGLGAALNIRLRLRAIPVRSLAERSLTVRSRERVGGSSERYRAPLSWVLFQTTSTEEIGNEGPVAVGGIQRGVSKGGFCNCCMFLAQLQNVGFS